MSSFWWNFHHWLHWKLSKWQLPVQPVIKISSKWQHFRFSVCQTHTPHHTDEILGCCTPAGEIWRVFCVLIVPWWRRQIEAFSALLALCVGISPVTGEFPSQRPVSRSFDVFFDLRLNKRLNKHSRRRWLETQSRSLWRHCNVHCVYLTVVVPMHSLHSSYSCKFVVVVTTKCGLKFTYNMSACLLCTFYINSIYHGS